MIDVISSIFILSIIALCFTISLLSKQSTHQETAFNREQHLSFRIIPPGPIYNFISGLGKIFCDLNISPNTLTLLGFLFSLLAGVFIVLAHFGIASIFACAAGTMDICDGYVARRSNRTTRVGILLDSMLDRYSDAFLLIGCALYYRGEAPILLLVLLALLGSFMISYSTAKAEAMNLSIPRGQMKRADRWVILLVGLVLSPFSIKLMPNYYTPWNSWPAIISIGIVAVFANISTFSRLNKMVKIIQRD